jgi:hypothetical protein
MDRFQYSLCDPVIFDVIKQFQKDHTRNLGYLSSLMMEKRQQNHSPIHDLRDDQKDNNAPFFKLKGIPATNAATVTVLWSSTFCVTKIGNRKTMFIFIFD